MLKISGEGAQPPPQTSPPLGRGIPSALDPPDHISGYGPAATATATAAAAAAAAAATTTTTTTNTSEVTPCTAGP